MPDEQPQIILNQEEAKLVLTSALDHSIGRMTYLPHTIVNIIKTHWNNLDEGTKSIIESRVVNAIEHYEHSEKLYNEKPENEREDHHKTYLGGDIDVPMWYEFANWLMKQEFERF